MNDGTEILNARLSEAAQSAISLDDESKRRVLTAEYGVIFFDDRSITYVQGTPEQLSRFVTVYADACDDWSPGERRAAEAVTRRIRALIAGRTSLRVDK